MSSNFSQPKIKLDELRQYVSASGNEYFSGYMGRTRLVLLRNKDAECTGKEIGRWNLLIEEAPPAEEKRPATSPAPAARSSSTSTRSYPPRRAGRKSAERQAGQVLRDNGIEPGAPIVDDELGF